MIKVKGWELRTGDKIRVSHGGLGYDVITGFRAYQGRAADGCARCADMASGLGIVAFEEATFTVIEREGPR